MTNEKACYVEINSEREVGMKRLPCDIDSVRQTADSLFLHRKTR
jgi:hypothetical protein